MEPLPDDVSASLGRALGLFVRSVPRRELPSALRRLAGFRPQTLLRHRDELIASLEDPALRQRILEWLEDRPPRVTEGEADVLRLAAERPDGWIENLRARSRGSDTRARVEPAQQRLQRTLEEERARSRRAREEARAARAADRRELQKQRAHSARLDKELRDVRRQLEQAHAQLEDERRAAATRLEEAERRLRRAERALDGARAQSAELKAELKEERRRALEAARRVRELESASRRARTRERTDAAAPRPPRSRGSRERRPLPTPKGRFADDPETLDDWLSEYEVRLLVDGYNVTKAPGGYGELALGVQRQRLVDALERLARRRGVRATVVFDGDRLPPGTVSGRRKASAVDVHYSRPPESGDDRLVALLDRLPAEPVIVVTDDRDLRDRVTELGATVARSSQLLALIRG